MRSPRKRTWFCSTSMVAPRREVSDAGLFELQAYVLSGQRRGLSPPGSRFQRERESGTHKMRERMEVFPLPDAPIRRT